MARLPEWKPRTVQATLAHEVRSPEGLRQFLTVRLKTGTRDEEIIAESAYKESGTITSLSNADGFVVIHNEATYLKAGTSVIIVSLL